VVEGELCDITTSLRHDLAMMAPPACSRGRKVGSHDVRSKLCTLNGLQARGIIMLIAERSILQWSATFLLEGFEKATD
jgi:hypothetical protein